MHCRMVSTIRGLYPLNSSSSPPAVTKSFQPWPVWFTWLGIDLCTEREVAGSIPSGGTCPGLWAGFQVEVCAGGSRSIDVSLSLKIQ